MKKILALSITTGVLALIIGFVPLAQAQVTSDTVTGTVTILAGGTCGLDATDGDPIAYGSLTPGSISGPKTLTVSNTGTTAADIYVSGDNWKGPVAGDIMLVGATHYTKLGQGPAYGDKEPLTATATNTGWNVAPGSTKSFDFMLQANLALAGYTGPSNQNVFLGSIC